MTFVAGSITGVPTIPTVGVMSPQGSAAEGTGVPTLFSHTTAPVAASSAYILSPTVATYAREPRINGWLQIGAPRSCDCQARDGGIGSVASGSSPERIESR